jgi:hypothetical protein
METTFPRDRHGADDVFEFLWLGPMIEAENLIMQPGSNVREKTERARKTGTPWFEGTPVSLHVGTQSVLSFALFLFSL